jgi:hypothetical protein
VRRFVFKKLFAQVIGQHPNSLPRGYRDGLIPVPVYVFGKAAWPEEQADLYVAGLAQGRDPRELTRELNERFGRPAREHVQHQRGKR